MLPSIGALGDGDVAGRLPVDAAASGSYGMPPGRRKGESVDGDDETHDDSWRVRAGRETSSASGHPQLACCGAVPPSVLYVGSDV